MIDVKSGQIRWSHVKPCQIMSKHVKCNVEIRRTYVFKGWICLPFLYNFQLRRVPCTLRPSTLSCRTTVILIQCFLCWPNRFLQSVPGKQNSGSSFVAHFLDFMVTNWLLRVWYCIANCHVPFCCETLCHSCRSLTRISWKHLKPFSWIPWGLSPHIAASAFVHSCQVNLSRPEVEGLLTALSRAQQGNLTCNYQCVVNIWGDS